MKDELVSFVFDHLDIQDDVQTINAPLDPRGPVFSLYICKPVRSGGNDIYITFNAPSNTPGVFFALSASRVVDAAQYVANLEEYNQESGRHLHHGDVVLTSGNEHRGFPYGCILLRTESYPLLERIPDQVNIREREIFFYLVMPITKLDYTYRANFGHDKLMDKFETEGRSLFVFD